VVPALGRTVDDVVVNQCAEVQQLDRGRAVDRGIAVAAVGQRQHETRSVPGPGRRGGREHAGNRFTEGGDDLADQAIDVAQQERLVRHGP
jgi:hypothetical protein